MLTFIAPFSRSIGNSGANSNTEYIIVISIHLQTVTVNKILSQTFLNQPIHITKSLLNRRLFSQKQIQQSISTQVDANRSLLIHSHKWRNLSRASSLVDNQYISSAEEFFSIIGGVKKRCHCCQFLFILFKNTDVNTRLLLDET